MQLVVFDLDYTLWQPEMYQIYGPPKLISHDEYQGKRKRKGSSTLNPIPPGSNTIHPNKLITDQRNTPITLFDGASHALSEIHRLKSQNILPSNFQLAISSRTDEPAWARQCLHWLTLSDGTPLSQCFHDTNLIEISYADKARHFESLHRKTGVPFDQMCFFDNEYWNVESVGGLGVRCFHTPEGMTREAWREALE